MKCNIQDTLEINHPEDLSDHPDVYNIEWDNENGQGWEMKNFIALTKDRNLLLDVGAYVGFFSFVFIVLLLYIISLIFLIHLHAIFLGSLSTIAP